MDRDKRTWNESSGAGVWVNEASGRIVHWRKKKKRQRLSEERQSPAKRSAVSWTRHAGQTGDSTRPPGSFGRVAFETNCRSVPVPFVLLSKRTTRSLVPDAGTSPSRKVRGRLMTDFSILLGSDGISQ